MTESMRAAIDETNRRREKQVAFNKEHGITPQTIRKAIRDIASATTDELLTDDMPNVGDIKAEAIPDLIKKMKADMHKASDALEFERAAQIRDKIKELEQVYLAFA